MLSVEAESMTAVPLKAVDLNGIVMRCVLALVTLQLCLRGTDRLDSANSFPERIRKSLGQRMLKVAAVTALPLTK